MEKKKTYAEIEVSLGKLFVGCMHSNLESNGPPSVRVRVRERACMCVSDCPPTCPVCLLSVLFYLSTYLPVYPPSVCLSDPPSA